MLCRECEHSRFPDSSRISRQDKRQPQGVRPIEATRTQQDTRQDTRPQPSAPPEESEQPTTDQVPSVPILNELLCFITNKISTMPYNMLVKLCVDFYKPDVISRARDVLHDKLSREHGPRHVTHRGENKALRDIQDIVNMFLQTPLHALPKFACTDLSNLPPLSMNNFDMASILSSIEALKVQVSLLQESHKLTADVQLAMSERLLGTDNERNVTGITSQPTVDVTSAPCSSTPTHARVPPPTAVRTSAPGPSTPTYARAPPPTAVRTSAPGTSTPPRARAPPPSTAVRTDHTSMFSADEGSSDNDVNDKEDSDQDLVRLATIQNRANLIITDEDPPTVTVRPFHLNVVITVTLTIQGLMIKDVMTHSGLS